MTTEIRNGDGAFITGGGITTDVNGNTMVNTAGARIVRDHDTFFTVNYGGGVKAMNVWGPVGFRADIRGRTIPNFFHQTVSGPR